MKAMTTKYFFKNKCKKINFFPMKIVTIFVCTLSISTPLTVMAVSLVDSPSTVKIDVVESKTAYPTGIRVTTSKNSVTVTGRVKRKKHTSLRIRGHVDIDLVNSDGMIVEHMMTNLTATSMNIKHNRFSSFTAVLPLPPNTKYTVRVTHTTTELDHSKR